MKLRSLLAALIAVVAAVAVTGCGSKEASTDQSTLTVFAAASLNPAFTEVPAPDGTEVSFSFGGSSGLVDQIENGAPADVLATADKRTMDRAVEAGLIDGDPVQFTTNQLVLVTPADNPAGITGVDDSLTDARVMVCEPSVPCGASTKKALEAAGVTITPASEETSVTSTLQTVTSGEADAAFVYRTDALAAGDSVKVFDVSGAEPNTYWIGAVKDSSNAEAAKQFIEAVQGSEGQEALKKHGFGD